MPDVQTQVGLLLDFENLVIPFQQKKDHQPGSLDYGCIVDFLEENFGPVILRRAYADWSSKRFNVYEGQLQNMGVEMIHVRRKTRTSKKNGADILLTADAVESLLLRPYIDAFAVVSGDSDIGPLVTKLKSHGKTVVVIGPDAASTAKHVIELADHFKFYTDIFQIEAPVKRGRSRRKSAKQAVIELLKNAGEPVESALLKRQLLKLPEHKEFNEKAQGFKTWTTFLRSIDEVSVKRSSDLGIEVSYREPR